MAGRETEEWTEEPRHGVFGQMSESYVRTMAIYTWPAPVMMATSPAGKPRPREIIEARRRGHVLWPKRF